MNPNNNIIIRPSDGDIMGEITLSTPNGAFQLTVSRVTTESLPALIKLFENEFENLEEALTKFRTEYPIRKIKQPSN